MHYYKRNIGDYHKKAGRLTMLQHGAYTLLIDSCYDREIFPTFEDAIDWTWASTDEEIAAVKFVLSKFFVLGDGFYYQNHIQEDLAKYHENSKTNKRIAIERERKKKERVENSTKRVQTVDKHEPNHKPLTTNQEPLTTKPIKRFVVPTIDEINIYLIEKGINDYSYAEKIWHFYESKGWVVGKNKMKKWKSAISSNWINSYQQQTIISNDRQTNRDEVRRKLMNPRDTNW